MKVKEKIECNGREVSLDTLVFSVKHSGFFYGLSVYETCLVKANSIAFYLEHIERLKLSSNFVQFDLKPSFWDNLKDSLKKFLKDEVHPSRLRIILSAKDILNSSEVDYVFTLTPILKHPESISLALTSIQKPYPNPFPPYLKISSNLYSLLSYKQAKAKGYEEGLMLTNNGLVAEGSYCNLFWYKNGKLYTPSLGCSILEGVTRAKILEATKILKIEVLEGEYTLEDLKQAEQVYISSSTRGLLPVKNLEEINYELQEIPMIKQIQAVYNELLETSLREW